MRIQQLATTRAEVFRPPAVVNGVRGEQEVYDPSMPCTAPVEASLEVVQRAALESYLQVYEMFFVGDSAQSVRAGWRLIISNRHFVVRVITPITIVREEVMHALVEEEFPRV